MLEWPPTPYGQLVYEMLVAETQEGRLTADQAKEFLDRWFKHDEETQ